MPYYDEFRRQRRSSEDNVAVHDCLEAGCSINPRGEFITAPLPMRSPATPGAPRFPLSWEQVSEEWMLGWPRPLAFSPTEILAHVNAVGDELGWEWVSARAGPAARVVVVLDLIEIGRVISVLRGVPSAEKLLRRLTIPSEFNAALAEGKVATLLIEKGCLVHLEPSVIVDDKRKRPDLHFESRGQYAYIEVARPAIPQAMREAQVWLNDLFESLNAVLNRGNVEVFVHKRPSASQASELLNVAVRSVEFGVRCGRCC